jgi:Zn-finger nucleic acid-binding protein
MSKLWFRPVFVCPVCEFVSYDPHVIRLQYCPRCHELMGQPYRNDGFLEALSRSLLRENDEVSTEK